MNNLDDLILSTSVGIAAALRHPLQRVGVLAAGIGAVAYINSTDDDPNNDPAVVINRVRHRLGDVGEHPGPDSDMPSGDLGSPARTWGLVAAGVGVLVAAGRVEKHLLKHPVARVTEGLVAGVAAYSCCQSVR